jgi:hypothetical protein
MRSVRIETHRKRLDQWGPVWPLQRIQPGVALGHLPASESNPYRTIQPAWAFRQAGQQRLAQEKAFPTRGDRPKPQSASLIALVQYHAPGIGRSLLAIPVEHSDKLFA